MMIKTSLLAAAILSLGAATFTPAFAGEGNGEPFASVDFGTTRLARPTSVQADVGQSQYPNVIGRPGSNLSRLANNEVLPAVANEQPIQTANSLPRGFEEGTVTYAQEQRVHNWMVAHNQALPNTVGGYASR